MDHLITATAEQLLTALERAELVAALTTLEQKGVAVGYQVQDLNIDNRVLKGDHLTGWKVALTNQAGLDRFKVNEPAYGPLLASMCVDNGGELSMNGLSTPKLEAELAFILGEELAGAQQSEEQLLSAITSIAPAIEIADCRVKDWSVNATAFVADNAAAARYCLGSPVPFQIEDYADIGCELYLNQEHLSSGTGSNVSGGPLNSLLWLLRALLNRGKSISKGQVILTGTLTKPVDITSGDKIRLEMLDSTVEISVVD